MDTVELKTRTKQFAKGCIKLLAGEGKQGKLFWHIEGQLIRCSTSVASNYRAACLAQSRAAFTAKISIVLEESDESVFWLEILEEEMQIKNKELLLKLKEEGGQLVKIFAATRKRMQAGRDKF